MIWKMPNTFFLSPKINCQTKIEVNELKKKKEKRKNAFLNSSSNLLI